MKRTGFAQPASLILLCLVASCHFEESRLRILNPEALSCYLKEDEHIAPTSATLVIFTGGKAKLMIARNEIATQVVRGRIDMLGVKTYSQYPIFFHFVADSSTVVPFTQAERSDTVRIVDVQPPP